ncbi:MAG: DUF2610 domain-containing protein [Verrucomicrobiales bacterium]|nr:DUF2610 domain-containing protein [Verrucomicrobiales bacterium]
MEILKELGPNYTGGELIGEGAFGTVYRVVYQNVSDCAVKFLKTEKADISLLKRELEKALSVKDGEGIIKIHHFDLNAESPYFVMDLYADNRPEENRWVSRTLDSLSQNGDGMLTKNEWDLSIRRIAKSTSYLHEKGIVHCDLKPGNIMITGEGYPIVCDFGHSRSTASQEIDPSGTPFFAPPEQLKEPGDPSKQWDVYSFGVLAYRAATGIFPRLNDLAEEITAANQGFDLGGQVLQTIQSEVEVLTPGQLFGQGLKTLTGKELAERTENESNLIRWPTGTFLPGEECRIIERCLSLDTSERFRDMGEVVHAFETIENERDKRALNEKVRLQEELLTKEAEARANAEKAQSEARKKARIFAVTSLIACVLAGIAIWQWNVAQNEKNKVVLAKEELEQSNNKLAIVNKSLDSANQSLEESNDALEDERDKATTAKQEAENERDRALKAEELANASLQVLRNEGLIGKVDLKGLNSPTLDAESHYYAAKEAIQTGEFSRAMTEIESGLKLFPGNKSLSENESVIHAKLLLQKTRIPSHQGNKAEALRLSTEALNILSYFANRWPDNWELNYVLCRIRNVKIISKESDITEYDYNIRQLTQLIDSSSHNYEVILWTLITMANATNTKDLTDQSLLERFDTVFDLLLNSLVESAKTVKQMEDVSYYINYFLTRDLGKNLKRIGKTDPQRVSKILERVEKATSQMQAEYSQNIKILTLRSTVLEIESEANLHGFGFREDDHCIQATHYVSTLLKTMGQTDKLSEALTIQFENYFKLEKPEEKENVIEDISRQIYTVKRGKIDTISSIMANHIVYSRITSLYDKNPNEPIISIYKELAKKFILEFTKASVDKKETNSYRFSKSLAPYFHILESEQKQSEITAIWNQTFETFPFHDSSKGERYDIIHLADYVVRSMAKSGEKESLIKLSDKTNQLSQLVLTDRDWDWHHRMAAIDHYFIVANAFSDLDDTSQMTTYRQKAWATVADLVGVDIDPENISPLVDRDSASGKGTGPTQTLFSLFSDKMFNTTIPCDVNGKKVSIRFQIIKGKNGYQRLLDQFKWLKEFRGIDIPADVNESFQKLNKIATENKVDFKALVTYALNANKSSKKAPAAADPVQFITNYFNSANRADLEKVILMFSDRLSNFYTRSNITISQVKSELKLNYEKWPIRQFTVNKTEKLSETKTHTTMRVHYSYELKSDLESASGSGTSIFKLQHIADSDFKIEALYHDE